MDCQLLWGTWSSFKSIPQIRVKLPKRGDPGLVLSAMETPVAKIVIFIEGQGGNEKIIWIEGDVWTESWMMYSDMIMKANIFWGEDDCSYGKQY